MAPKRTTQEQLKYLETQLLDSGDYARCTNCYDVRYRDDGWEINGAFACCDECRQALIDSDEKEAAARREMWADGHRGEFFNTKL